MHLLIAVVAGFAVAQLATLVTTVYLHRALAPRSLPLTGPAPPVSRVLPWIPTGTRPRQWVAVHRKHHAYTDVDGDPHSPVLLGYAKVQFGNVGLYRRGGKGNLTGREYAPDLRPPRGAALFFHHALLCLGRGIGFLLLTLGRQTGLG